MHRSALDRTFLVLIVTLLSPLRAEPQLLFEKKSPFGQVIVTEEDGLRTLLFEKGGARQSVVKTGDPAYLELPYARVAMSGLALCQAPRRVLVVGLGGGSLPMFVRHHYPDAVIDAVDINPEVVFVAREYFGFLEDARMHGIVADGRAFIEKTREPYDVIFLDAFGSDSVPPSLTTQEFLGAVRRAIRSDGVVIGNIWDRRYNKLYDSMLRTYQEVFDDLYTVTVPHAGNIILLALPRRENLSREALAGRAARIATARKFRFELGEDVRRGYSHLVEKNDAGRVLHDAELAPPRP